MAGNVVIPRKEVAAVAEAPSTGNVLSGGISVGGTLNVPPVQTSNPLWVVVAPLPDTLPSAVHAKLELEPVPTQNVNPRTESPATLPSTSIPTIGGLTNV